MKLILDAHIPPSGAVRFNAMVHDAIHTIALPQGNDARDGVLNGISAAEQRVVISKETDFEFSHLLHGGPWKLPLVRTGNIGRGDWWRLIERNLPAIVAALDVHSLFEIDRAAVSPVA